MDVPPVPVAPLAPTTTAPARKPRPVPAPEAPAATETAPAAAETSPPVGADDPEEVEERSLDKPHIADMRRNGLTYTGDGAVVMPPTTGRVVPPEDMDGPIAAYHVPDRQTLLWVVAHSYRVADPPAPEET